jgi:hypothetical protein
MFSRSSYGTGRAHKSGRHDRPATWPTPDGATLRRLQRGARWTLALPPTQLPTVERLAGWSSRGAIGCDQGVLMRNVLVEVDYRIPTPPYPRESWW